MITAKEARQEANRNNALEIEVQTNINERIEKKRIIIDEIEKQIQSAILLERFEISTIGYFSSMLQNENDLIIQSEIQELFESLGYDVSKGMCDVISPCPKIYFRISWKS